MGENNTAWFYRQEVKHRKEMVEKFPQANPCLSIRYDELESFIEAATERDTLAKALEVAVKGLQDLQTLGRGWISQAPMGSPVFTCGVAVKQETDEALSEIERIKGEK